MSGREGIFQLAGAAQGSALVLSRPLSFWGGIDAETGGVIDRSLVLAIDPAYFRLTGGIERWLYRVARKHAGRQPRGWLFEIAHLHEKSGSLVRVSDFALQIRRIAARQPLPGYRLRIERDDRRELLRILPAYLSTVPVDGAVDALGTSHANGIGIPHAALSGLRTHEPQLTLWPETAIPGLNLESNPESNSCSWPARSADKRATPAAQASEPPEQQPSLPFGRRPGGKR